MNHLDQWKALSARIHGLVQASTLYAQFLRVNSSDSYGSDKRLREQSRDVLTEILSIGEVFRETLPLAASKAIDRFAATNSGLIADVSALRDAAKQQLWTFLVSLAAFETEFSFLLSDAQEYVHTRSELAFHHLQRSIVADDDFRSKWQHAFQAGEVACEKLGAVHLLLHGIWAFKVDATGARTDLVFQEPVDTQGLQTYATGLVLTEWKKAAIAGEADQRYIEARLQAKRYSQGPLLGTELTRYRYVVVVSEHQIGVRPDLKDDDVVYRHINIAVRPLAPSKCQLVSKAAITAA
jgi:hypothetical protein